MSKFIPLAFSVLFSNVLLAQFPLIPENQVTMQQDAASRLVTVTYQLQQANAAIVTMDFETNVTGTADGPWVSIGAKNFTNIAGDVNRVVRGTGDHSITWRPDKSWPGYDFKDNRLRARVTAWATNAPPDYMVVNLTKEQSVACYASLDALPFGGLTNDLYRTDYLVMRKVSATGETFTMGHGNHIMWTKYADAEIPHLVSFTNDFFMSIYTVTKQQYWRIMGGTQPNANNAQIPQNNINWNGIRGNSAWPSSGDFKTAHAVGANTFLGKLRTFSGQDWFDYPTDAQWEFTCRAGTAFDTYLDNIDSRDYCATSIQVLDKIAWYGANSNGAVSPFAVGQKEPNPWGFYDMLGNAWEFCLDWSSRGANFSDGSHVIDPVGCDASVANNGCRIVRGGAVNGLKDYCRSAYRAEADPNRNLERYIIRLWHLAVVK